MKPPHYERCFPPYRPPFPKTPFKTRPYPAPLDSYPLPPIPLPVDPFPPPSKPRTYNPWETDMTLCIAAQCLWDGEVAVVAAFDERVETNTASSNSEIKYMPLNGSWSALLAGPVGQARELIELYIDYLSPKDITRANLLDHIRVPVKRMKARLADEVTYQLLAISHQEFLRIGQQSVSQEMCRHVEMQIAATRIEAQLILIGMVDGSPWIFLVSDGGVSSVSNFTTIGSGSVIAQAVLYQREQSPTNDITRAIYNVFESMYLGRNAPGVGPCRAIMILSASHGRVDQPMLMTFISDKSLEQIERVFEYLGPKDVPATLPMLAPTGLRLEGSKAAYTKGNAETDDPSTTSRKRQQEAKE